MRAEFDIKYTEQACFIDLKNLSIHNIMEVYQAYWIKIVLRHLKINCLLIYKMVFLFIGSSKFAGMGQNLQYKN